MKYIIYRLYFNRGLRIGSGRMDSSNIDITADILFSSLINEASYMNEFDCEKIIEDFKNGEFLISDGFPFIGKEYYLPKPLMNLGDDSGDSVEKKEFKKLKYIPLSKWSEFIEGNSDPSILNEGLSTLGNSNLDTKINHSEAGDNDIYNLSYYRFNSDNGIYFILGYKDKDKLNLIDELLYSLSFTGIGGKKSTGLGKFESISEELPKELEKRINNSSSNMLLTTSMAKKEELDEILNDDCNYALVKRAGFIYSENSHGVKAPTKRKKTMHFFKSGSIFSNQFEGDVFRVDDGFVHPVYRYGKPIWMGVDNIEKNI